jgi:hypothetical protein
MDRHVYAMAMLIHATMLSADVNTTLLVPTVTSAYNSITISPGQLVASPLPILVSSVTAITTATFAFTIKRLILEHALTVLITPLETSVKCVMHFSIILQEFHLPIPAHAHLATAI